jgi:hypothetical protein
MHSILFYSILFYQNTFYLEFILTRNERRDKKVFSGIDSHLRGDRDKSTSSVICDFPQPHSILFYSILFYLECILSRMYSNKKQEKRRERIFRY